MRCTMLQADSNFDDDVDVGHVEHEACQCMLSVHAESWRVYEGCDRKVDAQV